MKKSILLFFALSFRIVFRDANGRPVAGAVLVNDGKGLGVSDFAADKSRGMLSGKAAIEVGKEIRRLNADRPLGTVSPDAIKLWEHWKQSGR